MALLDRWARVGGGGKFLRVSPLCQRVSALDIIFAEFVPVFCGVSASICQGGMQQWAKEFSERPRDSCPTFVSRRLTLLLDLGEPTQKKRMLEVCQM